MPGARAYTLQDVLKQLNDQSAPSLSEDPTALAADFLGPMAETVTVTDALTISVVSGTVFVWGPPGGGQTALTWNLGQWG